MGKMTERKFYHVFFLEVFFPFIVVGKQNLGPAYYILDLITDFLFSEEKDLSKKGKAGDKARNWRKVSPLKELAEMESFRQLKPGVSWENLKHLGGKCCTENPAKGLKQ